MQDTTEKELAKLGDVSLAIAAHNSEMAKLKEKEKTIREKLREAMEAGNLKHIENDILSVTYLGESTRQVLDSAKLKQAKPEIWQRFSKTSKVKASIRIKVKNAE